MRRSAAFWVPAGLVHAVEPLSAGSTNSIYSSPRLRPAGERWNQARAIACGPLMAELIRHVSTGVLTMSTRGACCELLTDLLHASAEQPASFALPTHPAARTLAERILENPQDATSLAEHAKSTNVSARTLMRAFVTETGYGFAQWRAHARLIASLSLLAEHVPISSVAELVGYRTASGYIDAFRRVHGTTPAAYVRAASHRAARRGVHGGSRPHEPSDP